MEGWSKNQRVYAMSGVVFGLLCWTFCGMALDLNDQWERVLLPAIIAKRWAGSLGIMVTFVQRNVGLYTVARSYVIMTASISELFMQHMRFKTGSSTGWTGSMYGIRNEMGVPNPFTHFEECDIFKHFKSHLPLSMNCCFYKEYGSRTHRGCGGWPQKEAW